MATSNQDGADDTLSDAELRAINDSISDDLKADQRAAKTYASTKEISPSARPGMIALSKRTNRDVAMDSFPDATLAHSRPTTTAEQLSFSSISQSKPRSSSSSISQSKPRSSSSSNNVRATSIPSQSGNVVYSAGNSANRVEHDGVKDRPVVPNLSKEQHGMIAEHVQKQRQRELDRAG